MTREDQWRPRASCVVPSGISSRPPGVIRTTRSERTAVSDLWHACRPLFDRYPRLRPGNPSGRQLQAGSARIERCREPEVDLITVDRTGVSARVKNLHEL